MMAYRASARHAAEVNNTLESMDISAAVGVPAPEQPQAVAPMEAGVS